jgi:cytochrome b subunit of formate dehydrogenase
MIKRVLFGLMWFVIIFTVSYLGTGIIVVFPAAGTGSYQAMYDAAQAFRNTYIIFFAIGTLILAVAATITGVLPGTKNKEIAKKKTGGKKKAHKQGKL